MNPRLNLAISAVILVISFLGARYYVGSVLARRTHQEVRPPVQVVNMPARDRAPRSRPLRPPEPPAPPTPGERVASDLEGTLSMLTSIGESEPEQRRSFAQEVLDDLRAIDADSLRTVPTDKRASLTRLMGVAASTIPEELPQIRAGFEAERTRILETWKPNATASPAAPSAAD